jgi:2-iminobutanoate/2-iminopropanoate deaminase
LFSQQVLQAGRGLAKSISQLDGAPEAVPAGAAGQQFKPGDNAMARQQIVSDRIGKPSGHFSQANVIEARGRLVFISGMTSKRAVGSIAGVGDIEAQTRQMCDNVKAAVEAAGGTMADICRVDVYVKDMSGFDVIHRVRRAYFPDPPPASTMVAVSGFTHPDYLIEMNAIAVLPG